jgi:hypothetical protein
MKLKKPMRESFSQVQVICDGEVIFRRDGVLDATDVAEARKEARNAVESGRGDASLYALKSAGGDWLEIAHLKPKTAKQYFRGVHATVMKDGIPERLQLANRGYAEHLMDVALKAPRGRNEVGYLSVNLTDGEIRQELIKGIFTFAVSRSVGSNKLVYCILSVAGRTQELAELLQRAASGKLECIGKTPHYARSGRARVQSLSR